MKCPHCGQEHPDKFLFCPTTGKPIEKMSDNASKYIACTNPICEDFGKNILPMDSKFCPTCGKEIQIASERKSIEVKGVTFNMVKIEAGSFVMGNKNDSNASPEHEVIITNDFFIGETKVSQNLWEAVMGYNNSPKKANRKKGGLYEVDYPVEHISWDEADDFCTRLSNLTGRHFRLPTEAEWEFAARGGNRSKGFPYPGGDDVKEVCTRCEKHRVYLCSSKPNELGLYDMVSPRYEWVFDYFDYYYYSQSKKRNPRGPKEGTNRVIRGRGKVYERDIAYWPSSSERDVTFRVVEQIPYKKE